MKNRRKNPRIGRSQRRREIPAQRLGQHPTRRKRRGKPFLRFSDVKGKTVEFVEMYTAADFPCIEIGFEDKTALHFLMDTRLTMEPTYSNWKTGNQRLLRRWPTVDCR